MNTILIEGLDLAGKTSTCRTLVREMLPAPHHHRNALTQGNPLYEIADRLRRGRGLSGAHLGPIYAAAMALNLAQYAPPATTTIQESTIGLRSFAHYKARGMEDLAKAFATLLDDPAHPKFACSIVLTASIPARRARLEKRRSEAPSEVADDDLAVIATPDTFRRMEDILIDEATRRYRATVIDTSTMTAPEVVFAVRNVIEGAVAGLVRKPA